MGRAAAGSTRRRRPAATAQPPGPPRGLPVLAPRGEWSGVFEEADAALIVEACEAPAYLEALHQLSDPALWARKARNGRELVRARFQWRQVLEPLAALYEGR